VVAEEVVEELFAVGPGFELDGAFAVGPVEDGAVEVENNEEGLWALAAAWRFARAEGIGLGGHGYRER